MNHDNEVAKQSMGHQNNLASHLLVLERGFPAAAFSAVTQAPKWNSMVFWTSILNADNLIRKKINFSTWFFIFYFYLFFVNWSEGSDMYLIK